MVRTGRQRRHLRRTRAAKPALVSCLIAVALFAGPLPPAWAIDGFGVSYSYPLLLHSPRHVTFTGTVDCESAATITLRFRLFQDTISDPPAKATVIVDCVSPDAHPWSADFTGGIFHPGAASFHVRATACDARDCLSFAVTSGAHIWRPQRLNRPHGDAG